MGKEQELFEKNWEIFVLTGMPWHEIKGLSESDRDNMYAKTIEAKNKALAQIKAREKLYASRGLDPNGDPLE